MFTLSFTACRAFYKLVGIFCNQQPKILHVPARHKAEFTILHLCVSRLYKVKKVLSGKCFSVSSTKFRPIFCIHLAARVISWSEIRLHFSPLAARIDMILTEFQPSIKWNSNGRNTSEANDATPPNCFICEGNPEVSKHARIPRALHG